MLSRVVALDFSLIFETPLWHQKGRLVFFVTLRNGEQLVRSVCEVPRSQMEVHLCAKWAQCCILAFNLSPCVCGVFTEFLHSAYLTIRGKFFRAYRWLRQARTPLLTACGGVAKSARCCPPRPSRRFAQRAME